MARVAITLPFLCHYHFGCPPDHVILIGSNAQKFCLSCFNELEIADVSREYWETLCHLVESHLLFDSSGISMVFHSCYLLFLKAFATTANVPALYEVCVKYCCVWSRHLLSSRSFDPSDMVAHLLHTMDNEPGEASLALLSSLVEIISASKNVATVIVSWNDGSLFNSLLQFQASEDGQGTIFYLLLLLLKTATESPKALESCALQIEKQWGIQRICTALKTSDCLEVKINSLAILQCCTNWCPLQRRLEQNAAELVAVLSPLLLPMGEEVCHCLVEVLQFLLPRCHKPILERCAIVDSMFERVRTSNSPVVLAAVMELVASVQATQPELFRTLSTMGLIVEAALRVPCVTEQAVNIFEQFCSFWAGKQTSIDMKVDLIDVILGLSPYVAVRVLASWLSLTNSIMPSHAPAFLHFFQGPVAQYMSSVGTGVPLEFFRALLYIISIESGLLVPFTKNVLVPFYCQAAIHHFPEELQVSMCQLITDLIENDVDGEWKISILQRGSLENIFVVLSSPITETLRIHMSQLLLNLIGVEDSFVFPSMSWSELTDAVGQRSVAIPFHIIVALAYAVVHHQCASQDSSNHLWIRQLCYAALEGESSFQCSSVLARSVHLLFLMNEPAHTSAEVMGCFGGDVWTGMAAEMSSHPQFHDHFFALWLARVGQYQSSTVQPSMQEGNLTGCAMLAFIIVEALLVHSNCEMSGVVEVFGASDPMTAYQSIANILQQCKCGLERKVDLLFHLSNTYLQFCGVVLQQLSYFVAAKHQQLSNNLGERVMQIAEWCLHYSQDPSFSIGRMGCLLARFAISYIPQVHAFGLLFELLQHDSTSEIAELIDQSGSFSQEMIHCGNEEQQSNVLKLCALQTQVLEKSDVDRFKYAVSLETVLEFLNSNEPVMFSASLFALGHAAFLERCVEFMISVQKLPDDSLGQVFEKISSLFFRNNEMIVQCASALRSFLGVVPNVAEHPLLFLLCRHALQQQCMSASVFHLLSEVFLLRPVWIPRMENCIVQFFDDLEPPGSCETKDAVLQFGSVIQRECSFNVSFSRMIDYYL